MGTQGDQESKNMGEALIPRPSQHPCCKLRSLSSWREGTPTNPMGLAWGLLPPQLLSKGGQPEESYLFIHPNSN